MRIIVQGAYLIDGTGADPRPDTALVIERSRIVAIDSGNGLHSTPGAKMIDVGGRTVIPGLFNCHVHLQLNGGPSPLADLVDEPPQVTREAALQRAMAMLRRGITTVRDCGARDWEIIELRAAIEKGEAEGPRILACGRAIGAAGGHAAILCEPVATDDDVSTVAGRQLAHGADFIKAMGTGGFGRAGERLDQCELTADQIRVAAEVAHAAGRRLTVHAYGTQGIRNAITGGADSIEHATFVDEETLALLRASGTFIVPTLTNTARVSHEGAQRGVAADVVAGARSVFPTMMANAQKVIQAGIKMAVGTDAGSWLNSHTDIVTEIRLRVEAGASPLVALTMATGWSAECLGIADVVGTLEPGKLADLVILEGNPLENLSALEHVHSVYQAGRAVRPASAAV